METATPSAKRLLELADNMASAAVMFNSHGYDNFISAREELKIALKQVTSQESNNKASK